jgi:CRP/FNR family cyclic AMP-dependent transcriptional regulator
MSTDPARHPYQDHLTFLRSVKLFALLDEGEVAALHATLRERAIGAGTHLFHEGEQGDSLFIVQSGSIEIYANDFEGQKLVLTTLSRGDIFGETAVFDPGPRSASAETTEESVVWEFPRTALLEFLRSKPEASIHLLAMISRRLREADHLLMGRVTDNANAAFENKLSLPQRIANWIADFSGSMPFLAINALIFLVWIVINVELIPGIATFDPYPFGFLTMSVSLEAIFLSIVVLLAQNLNSAKERVRNDIEYEVNLKAERKVTELHRRITHLHNDISRRLTKLEERR